MSSEIDQIADAVAGVLNGASLTPSFTAQRVYLPLRKLQAIDTLVVLVVPKEDDVSKLSRDAVGEDISIDIGVIQHLPVGADPALPVGNETIDPLVRLCRRIVLLFGPGLLVGTDAQWLRTKYSPIFDSERLLERVFLALVTVTFTHKA